jgi:RND superfamily putative drug exporter
VITAAALIMVSVFGAFSLSSEMILKFIGVGLASAVLIDGILIRMVLLPGVMHLLGERAWWRRGGKADQRLARDAPRGELAA